MILAAISFADPLMLAGALAAAVPLVLHLLNRVRAPVVPFPTLRFLRMTAQKTARRRQVQQYLLLLVRMLVFLMMALAIASPLIRGGSSALAYGMFALMLGAMVLLVLGGVWGWSAKDAAAGNARGGKTAAGARRPMGWAAVALALLLAVLGGWGLASDRFFAAQRGGQYSGASTAMVIIFDNSHSMLARQDSQTRLARAKEIARQLLTGNSRPVEAAVLPTNGPEISGGLTGDMNRLLGAINTLEPTGSAAGMGGRIKMALEMLGKSQQADRMLVIVSDFAQVDFSQADVFAATKGAGFAKDLQLVLLPVGSGAVEDAGVVSFGLSPESETPALGGQVVFDATVVNNNRDAADARDAVITVDGQAIAGLTPTRVQLGAAGTPAGRSTVHIPLRVSLPGEHRYGITIGTGNDAMAWDDQREVVLNVADRMRVLVIGAENGAASGGGPRARSAAFYAMSALAPFENAGGTGAGAKAVPWAIVPAYRGIGEVKDADIAGVGAVFLCDVPAVPAGVAKSLQNLVNRGGRLAWVLGPSVNATSYNALGDLLPGKLAAPLVQAKADELAWVDQESGLFAHLFENLEPYREVLVTGRWMLEKEPNGRVLAKLEDGSPLVIEHTPAGASAAGRVDTILTSPAGAWSNLGATVLMVPLVSRMALLTGGSAAAAGYEAGDVVALHPTGLAAAASIDVTTPGKAVINVRSGNGEWRFRQTQAAGIYQWKSSDNKASGMFVVNVPGEEADLFPADAAVLGREAMEAEPAQRPVIVAAGVPEMLSQLQARGEGTSLMPGVIAMVLVLAVAEALMANRGRSSELQVSSSKLGLREHQLGT